MVLFNKFNETVQDLGNGVPNLSSNTLNVMLTNTAPTATDHVFSDLVEISAGNGYVAGGIAVPGGSWVNAAGVSTMSGGSVTWTAGPGDIGPFQYPVVYDATTGTLFGWWDYGSPLTLAGATADQFRWAPDGMLVGGTIFTLA